MRRGMHRLTKAQARRIAVRAQLLDAPRPTMLEFLLMRGEVAIAGRIGRQRVWDLADRVYPADVAIPSVDEAHRLKNERRLATLGIARPKTTAVPVEPWEVGEA